MRYTLAIILALCLVVPTFAATPSVTKDGLQWMAEGKAGGYNLWNLDCEFSAGTAGVELLASSFLARQGEGPYRPDTPGPFYVVSTDASDDGSVEVYYLDSNYDAASEVLDLNGQTEVASIDDAIRVYYAVMRGGGANDGNAGIVSVYHASGATLGEPDDHSKVFLQIPAEYGSAQACLFTVPRNSVGVLTSIKADFEGGAIPATRLYVADELGSIVRLDSSGLVPRELPAKTDLWMSVVVGSSGDVHAGLQLYTRPE